MRPLVFVSFLAISFSWLCGGSALAADECTGFKWDVSKEHALFGGTSVNLVSGADPATAPSIRVQRLYLLQLSPQSAVQFAAGPGKQLAAADAFAGLVRLKIDAPGNYRVSVDVPLWIDVVADAKLTPPVDYQGQRDCSAPHKIVEFALAGGTSYVLQISGSATTNVRLAVTAAPVRTN
jgi:hypothetical protein